MKKKIVFLTIVSVFAALLYGAGFTSDALFDTSTAVHINPDEIDDSTLIIGTHLIYLHALTDDLYDVAVQSASDANQDRRYYKSELAGGVWYDITDATSLKDITSEGRIAENSEISALYMTHHTKPDGITYALSDGRAVNIFNTYNVYDLEKMPELQQLKLQYDLMKESGAPYKEREYVRRFFQTDIQTGTTRSCDVQTSSLQLYYQVLAAYDAPMEERNSVSSVMKKVDNARKADICNTVEDALLALEKNVADVSNLGDGDGGSPQSDDGLLTAIANSQSALSDSKTQAQGGLLEEGGSVLSKAQYDASAALISHAVEQDHSACDADNKELINLGNIENSMIADRDSELATLQGLIGKADMAYMLLLQEGETQEYKALKAGNAAHAALSNRIRQDMSKANAARSEMQFFIQEKTGRMEQEEASAYILERIGGVAAFRKAVAASAYKSSADATVDTYEAWLGSLLNSVKQSGGTPDGESLYEQKEALKEQKMEALDSLNLDTAKKINVKLEQVDRQIRELESAAENAIRALEIGKKEIEEKLASDPGNARLLDKLSSLEAEIADKTTDFPSDSGAANISAMKTDAKGLIRKADPSQSSLDALSGCIDGLAALAQGGSALALDAMKEIYKEMAAAIFLNDADLYKDLMGGLEETIVNIDIPGALADTVTPQSAAEAAGEALGKDLGDITETLTDAEAAGVVIAFAEYGERSGNGELTALAKNMASTLAMSSQGYLFRTHLSEGELFAPVDVAAHFTGYRYLWNDTKKEAVLSQGASYYRFTASSRQVSMGGGQSTLMGKAAEFDTELYLPDSYLQEEFGCSVYTIYGTDYSALASQEVKELARRLLEQLMEL